MSQPQVDGLKAILRSLDVHGVLDQEERAYVLATAYWETSRTMSPVREAFWLSEKWRRNNLRYYPYYGRGHVQLTWKRNYEVFSKLLDIDLVNKPDLAMDPQTSAYVLVVGMKGGLFSPAAGPLSKYLGAASNWLGARKTVNGSDRKADIAAIGKKFDAAFELAEGPVHATEPTIDPGGPSRFPTKVTRPTPAPKVLPESSFWLALVRLVTALWNSK